MPGRHRVRGLGKIPGVELRLLEELLGDADAACVLAQVLKQLAGLAVVKIENKLALARQRLAHALGRDVRVTVHVAADPGRELDHGRHAKPRAALDEGLRQRGLERLVELRHHAVEHVRQEEQHVLGLIAEVHLLARELLGLPAGRHLEPDRPELGGDLVGRHVGVEHVQQVARDVLLLAQQGAARDLGRMGREDGLDAGPGDGLLDAVGVDAFGLEPLQHVPEPERLRLRRFLGIGAPAPYAVNLLGHVDDLEVGRERSDEVACRARRQRREQGPELGEGAAVAFAVRDRSTPRGLDEVVQRLAGLLANELADELAEPMHVLAQRLILLGEEDVGAQYVLRFRYGHLKALRGRPRGAASTGGGL